MRKSSSLSAIAVVCLLLQVSSGFAATYRWVSSIATSWTNSLNWIPNGVPGDGDIALVGSSIYRYSLDLPAELGCTVYWTNGEFRGNTFIKPGGAVILVPASSNAPQNEFRWSGNVTNAGVIEFTGPLRVDGGPSTLVNLPGGIVRKSRGALDTLGTKFPFRILNEGRIESSEGSLFVGGGGVLGGEIVASNGASVVIYGGEWTLTNFTRAGDGFFGFSTASNEPVWPVRVNGIINGPLGWRGGNLTGSIRIGPTGVMAIDGPSPLTLVGGITNEGTILLDGDLRFSTTIGLIINRPGGMIRKSGVGAGVSELPTLSNEGKVDVQSGILSLAKGGLMGGEFSVASNAALHLNAGTFTLNSYTLSGPGFFGIGAETNSTTLAGVLNGPLGWKAGNLSSVPTFKIGSNGVLKVTGAGRSSFLNLATNEGTIDFEADMNISFSSFRFRNPPGGTIRKSAGNNVTHLDVWIDNLGTLESRAGTLSCNIVEQPAGGAARLLGGDLKTISRFDSRGELSGTGRIFGTVINRGLIRPGDGLGTMTIEGNLTQTLEGALEIELGGLTAGLQHDRLIVNGYAVLHGGMNVVLKDGFLPAPGNVFNVVTASGISGALPRQNGLNLLGSFRRLNLEMNETAIRLTTETVEQELPKLNITRSAPATVAWPTEFDGWLLLTTTNLADPVLWSEIPTTSNFTTNAVEEVERYWKLTKPQ